MSNLPPLIKENEPTDAGWRVSVRNLLNLTARRTLAQGKTAERPKGAVSGSTYYDETLKKPIWLDPAGVWRDAAGTAV